MVLSELTAMQAVADALTDLSDEEKTRVLAWILDYFKFSQDDTPHEAIAKKDDISRDASGAEEFRFFGDLFAAVDPRTNEDKALVAAYWIQVVQGNDQWQSATIQKELKDLGHAIRNVSDAIACCEKKRPQKIVQLKKNGKSRQARKTFKLSEAGIQYIQNKLYGNSISCESDSNS